MTSSCKLTGKVDKPVRSISRAAPFPTPKFPVQKASPFPTPPKFPMKIPRRGQTQDKRQLLLAIIPITTFCLGTWQILRLQWKVGLIDKLETKTKQAPILIPNEWGYSSCQPQLSHDDMHMEDECVKYSTTSFFCFFWFATIFVASHCTEVYHVHGIKPEVMCWVCTDIYGE